MIPIIESPINYMGSKHKLLPQLLALFPQKKTFYDIFTGGGSIYINIAHRYQQVVANDILTDLIAVHRQLQCPDFIHKAAALSIPTKACQQSYLTLRERYNKEHAPEQLLALIWSCNSNMMRFNKDLQFNQTWGQRAYNQSTQNKIQLFQARNYTNVKFENKHFYEYINLRDQDAFIYLDPPYSNTEAGYNNLWTQQDEQQLISLLQTFITHKTAFGLSGVLNEKNNAIYNFFQMQPVSIYYLGDMYQKVSKKERTNIEYYITNSAAA